MQDLLIPFLTSFLITLFATPIVIKIAKASGMVDDPSKRPHPAHVHKDIVPRAGGLPIYLGLLLSILIFVPLDKHVLGILAAISLLLVVGLIDDLKTNFSPYPRLILQFLAAAIVVGSGVGISYITNPLGSGVLRLDLIDIPLNFYGEHHLLLLADIFAFLWIVWMMNAINWSKGVDGQMPGIVTIASLTISILSYGFYLQGDPNQLLIAIIAIITCGASLVFLIFNWYPAKILPGFSASTILGFMIATLSILSGAKLATALLVLLIPSIDFFYTFFRRILSGHSPFHADDKHLHHLLLKRGFKPYQISLFYIFSCAILGLLAINLSSEGKLFATLFIGTIILSLLIWLHSYGHSLKKSVQDNG